MEKRSWPLAWFLGAAAVTSLLNVGTVVQAADEAALPEQAPSQIHEADQVIVQIGGRFCEYHREDVEGALRQYPVVQQVEFLNDHGTVLVRYRPDGAPPAQLAASVEQALASGIGCKAWVDRGGSPLAKS
ncbi:MAG: hypothetical protein IT389_13025 [Nitrospira sp.]|nr:hypothetical protein [Nitrospira sp.]